MGVVYLCVCCAQVDSMYLLVVDVVRVVYGSTRHVHVNRAEYAPHCALKNLGSFGREGFENFPLYVQYCKESNAEIRFEIGGNPEGATA